MKISKHVSNPPSGKKLQRRRQLHSRHVTGASIPNTIPRYTSEQTRNSILEGVHGAIPDPEIFRRYMASRGYRGHIPTLLKDWVTAHAAHHAEALRQVRDWVEQNPHLFKPKAERP